MKTVHSKIQDIIKVMSIINERISALRTEMKKRNLNAYIIPSDDFHASEYVGAYFKARAFLSGFTGSAGTLVVLENEAGLWTDGRYFLQAAAQLEGSGIDLMKMGEQGVPEIPEYLESKLQERAKVGYDARVITAGFAKKLREAAKCKNIEFEGNEDLADFIWKDRPEMSKEKVWELPENITGCSRKNKISDIRKEMQNKKKEVLVLSALDEIAWTLNLRGNDVECTPVFLAFMIITGDKALLFAADEIFNEEIKNNLLADGVTLLPYNDVYKVLEECCTGKALWLDENRANERLMSIALKAESVFTEPSPVEFMKAIKSYNEQKGYISAHIKDGIAVTHFIYWLQKNVGKEKITELQASDKICEFRSQQEGFIEPSFGSIIAYGAHGAIVHYGPTEESDWEMKAEGFCLADTGGHYKDGSTDITRTIPLGPLTDEEKKMYTLVLKGHLALADAKFVYGCTGGNLDYLAREPMWAEGLDYNHGTGHGVGFIMSVHEGPHNIHWNVKKRKQVVLEEGMIVSDEPGMYLTGKFGIRHENLILVKTAEENEYGKFMKFQNLTLVPFDKDAIDFSLFDDKDYIRLNAYHKQVWDTLEFFFEGEEKEWLREKTSAVNKK